MKISVCITALAFFGATAFARIGETEAQIEKRYGRSISGSGLTKGYFYKAFFIIVTFDNRVSAIEAYEKRTGGLMSAAEIRTLLEANGGGAKWQKSAESDFELRYEAKSRSAEYNAVTNTLTIADSGALNRINAHNHTRDGQSM
jgi:hypothetical protein